jgi:DNA-binding beta-propeller fold protein YncE
LAFPGLASAIVPLSSFGASGSGPGQFQLAGNLDVAPNGSLYVPDLTLNRVSVFSPSGEFRFAFGKDVNPAGGDVCTAATGCRAGVASAAAGALAIARALAVGPEGDVYVASQANQRVDVFSPTGEFRFAFGKEVRPGGGGFCTAFSGCRAGVADSTAGSIQPVGIAVDRRGRVYLADPSSLHNRVDVFSAQGGFEFAFGKGVNLTPQLGGDPDICTGATGCRAGLTNSVAGTLSGVNDLDFLPNGDVAVLTFRTHRVSVFSSQGEFRFAFGKGVNPQLGGNPDVCTAQTGCEEGGGGSAAGELGLAAFGLAASPSGALYIADGSIAPLNERVSQFAADGTFVRAFGIGVIDGSEVFQVCTVPTGCRAGLGSQLPGGVGDPRGIAVDDGGTVYVAENHVPRIELFGESGSPTVVPPSPSGQRPPGEFPPGTTSSLELGKLKLNRKKGTATLTVEVSGAGGLVLKGKGVRKASRAATGAGAVTLPVALLGKAERKLLATGEARVRVVVTFSPSGGPLAKAKALVLKKNLG